MEEIEQKLEEIRTKALEPLKLLGPTKAILFTRSISGSGDKSRSPLYCLNSLKTLHLKLVAQVHSSPKKSTQVQGVGVKMVGCPVRLYGIEVLSEENKMLDFQ